MPLKTGRLPKIVDPRTLKYAKMRVPGAWRPQATWNWDAYNSNPVPCPMFLNDELGDCVIAGRAHHSLAFEFAETGVVLPITDEEVRQQYFRETGGRDSGLIVLESLKNWRNQGWIAGGKRLFIHSFMDVNFLDPQEVMEASLVGLGVQVGVDLPISASDQINAGAPWEPVTGSRGVKGSWGGHLVHSRRYQLAGVDRDGIVFKTWGRDQLATWPWLEQYGDECHLVIDDVDRPSVWANVQVPKLDDALSNLS